MKARHPIAPPVRPATLPGHPVSPSAVADRKLQEAVQRSLNAAGYQLLTRITVHVDNGHVHLTGNVPSYHMKQLATVATLKLDAATELSNDLCVSPR